MTRKQSCMKLLGWGAGGGGFPGRKINKCKDPEVGMSVAYSWGNNKTDEAGAAGEESRK